MPIVSFWENLNSENKILIKQIGIAAISLYIVSQLVVFLFPIALTSLIAYLGYTKYISPNPRVMK